MPPKIKDLETGKVSETTEIQKSENGLAQQKKWNIENIAANITILVGIAGGLYFGSPLFGLLAPIASRSLPIPANTGNMLARRSDNDPLIELSILNQNAVSGTSALAIAMLNTTTGQSITIWPEFNSKGGFYGLVGKTFDSLNFPLSSESQVNFLNNANQVVLTSNTAGYTVAWNVGGGQFGYQYLNPAGQLQDPLALDFNAGTSMSGAISPTIVASSPLNFLLGFSAPTYNAVGSFYESMLYTQSIINNSPQSVVRFTQQSYNSGPSVYYFAFYQPMYIQDNTNSVFAVYARAYKSSAGTTTPPTIPTEICYTQNPQSTTNAQGTSLTASNFAPASYCMSPNVPPACAVMKKDNTKVLAFLVRPAAGPVNTFNVYVQRLTTVMGLNGAPIQIPVTVSDLNGVGAPTVVETSYGFGVFIAGTTVSNPTAQAYFIGYNSDGSIHTNLTAIYPSSNTQSFATGAIAGNGNIIARYQETVGTHFEYRGVARTPNLQVIMGTPNSNPAYTQNTVYNLPLALTFPINTITGGGNTTTRTISLTNGGGTLLLPDTLPATTTVQSYSPTQIVLKTTSATLLQSIIDDNSVLVPFMPANNNVNNVAIAVTAQAGTYTASNTFQLPGKRVNYTPQLINSTINLQQGETIRITNTQLAGFIQDGNFTYDMSTQHCNFILVPPGTTDLSYPGTIVNDFSPATVDNNQILLRHDGSVVPPIIDTTLISNAGISSATTRITPTFTLNPAINPNQPTVLMINQGGTTFLTSQIFNATSTGVAPDQLFYEIIRFNGLMFQNNGENFPGDIEYSQAAVNAGNQISIIQDGTTNIPSFSYQIKGPNGALSTPMNAVMQLNTKPIFTQFEVTITQLDHPHVLKPTEISVQDNGPINTRKIFITRMKDCSITNNGAALQVGDSYTQDDVNQGMVDLTVKNKRFILELTAVNQYDLSSDTVTVVPNFNLPKPAMTAEQKAFTAASLTLAGIGLLWRWHNYYRVNTVALNQSPLIYLIVTKTELSESDGPGFFNAINKICEHLQNNSINAFGFEGQQRENLAQAFADYFNSEAGKKYIEHSFEVPPITGLGSCLAAPVTVARNTLSWAKVWNIKKLNYSKVFNNADGIATEIANKYRNNLRNSAKGSNASLNRSNIEMNEFGGGAAEENNSNGSGSSLTNCFRKKQ